LPYGGTAETIPAGYLICNGNEVSRSTFPDLFTAIGTTYGEGDGSSTDASGYTNTHITLPSGKSYITSMACSEWGLLPSNKKGSAITYYADELYVGSGTNYLYVGGRVSDTNPNGPFKFTTYYSISETSSDIGCGLSYV
jgi:hypothetical protein